MTVHEYGAWPSPIAAADVHSSRLVRTMPATDGGTAYWLEVRPDDDGRSTLVRQGGEDVSARGHDVRTRFHEYGGGAYAVHDGVVLYVEFSSQRVWRTAAGAEPRPITPECGGRVRFAGFRIDLARGVAFCLREDQRDPGVEPVTSLVRLDLDGPNDDFGVTVVAGRERPVDGPELPADVDSAPDFVLDPVLSPDGSRIAWLSWNHPNMAWDGTWLRVAALDEAGDLAGRPVVVAGGETEAIEQPAWLEDDRLLFLTDRTGWSGFAVADLSGSEPVVGLLTDSPVDHGRPRWTPGTSSYCLVAGRVVTLRIVEGRSTLALLDPSTGAVSDLPSGLSFVRQLAALDDGTVLVEAHRPDAPPELVLVAVDDGSVRPVFESEPPDPGLVSEPEMVTWPTTDGSTANGFLYTPANPEVTGPEGSLPPLIVTLHGGPTASAIPGFDLGRAFWTSRGFAVLDVNYAGSVGFGRAYRQRLEGRWGVADVEDVVTGVAHLADVGRIDGSRALIQGGSAGGFTTLVALTSSDAFAAGCSLFGVSDLAALARDTHKLESRYLWRLVAPWPEGAEVYAERSPLNRLDRLRTPLVLLQGTDDRVVPPAQTELLAEALRARGLPVAVVMFEGEGHGFRAPATLVRALEVELSFYAQVLGLPHPEDVEPVPVENL